MRFTRLRLSGFKSFVEPTEFLIQPGLTGIVGPNGCGKSNLLEAMRWVMGATSAKAMRGSGMDDVIFAGADGRPARSHAEATLTVENEDASAPPPFRFEPVLEVTRRIDRGEGSTYRVNGAEVRARDVQLLFADASTGANSPALVRQGQISELIAARPQNRRRILEEAAGVSGLYGRRHEAELRVAAAETNLARVEDVRRELESGLAKLWREARAAVRYKKLAADIRALRAAIHLGKWESAAETTREALKEWRGASGDHEKKTVEVAAANTEALNAATDARSGQEEQAVAASLYQRVLLETGRLERSITEMEADLARRRAALERSSTDLARETQDATEARQATERAGAALREIEAELAQTRLLDPSLEQDLRIDEAGRQTAESAVENLANEIATSRARAQATRDQIRLHEQRYNKLNLELEKTNADQATLLLHGDPRLSEVELALEASEVAGVGCLARVRVAEEHRSAALAQEAAARVAAQSAEGLLAGARVEHEALERLVVPTSPETNQQSALDQVAVQDGFELALGAALGDDLDRPINRDAQVYWEPTPREAVQAMSWPADVLPLSSFTQAPPALNASLSLIGLVDQALGGSHQSSLVPGARLVSREGGLWRWDGFVVRPGSHQPTGARLQQRNRLAELASSIDAIGPVARKATEDHALAQGALIASENSLNLLRAEASALEVERQRLSTELTAVRRGDEQRLLRLASLEQTVIHLARDKAEANAEWVLASNELSCAPDDLAMASELQQLRVVAASAREAVSKARAALEGAAREDASRRRRALELRQDQEGWLERSRKHERRIREIQAEISRAAKEVDAFAQIRPGIEASLKMATEALAPAERRSQVAVTSSATSEARRSTADHALRAAEARLADARERKSLAFARHEAAQARQTECAALVLETTGLEPDELARSLSRGASALAANPQGRETQLALLEREQASVGLVNLLAEDEADALTFRLQVITQETGDLTGAITRLRQAIGELNAEGRDRLNAAFTIVDGHFRDLFTTLFQGGAAELRLIDSEDPLEAGLEVFACPPGKRMASMSLMSGGEQALTAVALIFAVFLANPAPVCVLDEVDAPLDDANVERLCNLLDEMRARTVTRFITITHNPLTMSRMDRLFGVTMRERGVSQLVSVDLGGGAALLDSNAKRQSGQERI